MAKEGRPADEDAPRSAKRRRRPPTLDLKAKEIGGSGKAQGAATQESANKEKPSDDAGGAQGSSWEKLLSRTRAGDWRGLVPTPVLTGALGVLAGALIVYALTPRADGSDPRVGRLSDEVASLSAQIESLAKRPLPAPASDQSGLGARIDRLTAAIGEAEQRLAAVEKRPEPKTPDLTTVNQRTAGIEDTLKDLRTSIADLRRVAERTPEAASAKAVETLSGRIGGLEERISKLAAARAVPAQEAALATDIVALNALGRALRAGGAFKADLDSVRARLGERAAKLAPLESYAAAGLPTVEMLAVQFAELAPKLLRGAEPNGNFFERLMTNASRLVEVRPVGEPAGTSIGAIVARTESKLGRGDLNGAIAEVESLPEPAKGAAAKWLAAATQRRDAEALVQSLSEALLAQVREAAKP